MSDTRSYSLPEANGMLPDLRQVLARLREARDRVIAVRQELEALWRRAEERGVLDVISQRQREMDALSDDLRSLAGWFDERRIILRDLDRGLVDFPSRLGERPIFLCWIEEEAKIEHWHGVEEGFAGRRRFADPGKRGVS